MHAARLFNHTHPSHPSSLAVAPANTPPLRLLDGINAAFNILKGGTECLAATGGGNIACVGAAVVHYGEQAAPPPCLSEPPAACDAHATHTRISLSLTPVLLCVC